MPGENRIVCAGQGHEKVIREALSLPEGQFLGEPVGRDTLNAVGYSTAVIAGRDPEAVIAIFTADHIIEPIGEFQRIVEHGYRLAEENAETLVTFGIAPTQAATGYGYLQLGGLVDESARVVEQFREKPSAEVAEEFFKAGAEHYLWNSGMFVWRAATLLDCVRRYEPENYAGIEKIAGAWNGAEREKTLAGVFPTLKKISIDYAVMSRHRVIRRCAWRRCRCRCNGWMWDRGRCSRRLARRMRTGIRSGRRRRCYWRRRGRWWRPMTRGI